MAGRCSEKKEKKKKKKKKKQEITWAGLIGASQLTILIWLAPHVFPAVFT